MTYKPTIKNHHWLTQTQEKVVLHQILYKNKKDSIEKTLLNVAYAIDMEDKIGYLSVDTFPELTTDQIHQQALSNLRNHLSPLNWELNVHQVGNKEYTIAYFTGDYYAAEVILLQERMLELHSRLKSKRLLVSMPIRGLLVAIPFDDEDPSFLEAYLSIIYEQYESAPEAERLSDVVWIVTDGEIGGTLSVNQEYRDWHQRVNLNETDAVASDDEPTLSNTEAVTLYTPAQLAIASFIGTPLAGFIAIGLNFFSLGKRKNAAVTWVLGVIILCGLVALYIYVPRTDYDRLVPGVTALIIAITTKILFFRKPDTQYHWKRQSVPKLIAVIVVGLLMSFSVLVAAGIVLEHWS